MSITAEIPEIETHPWEPFIPEGAKVLIMGTFPPQRKRWSMDFYYPNRTNDFWKICGLIFLNDKNALMNPDLKTYNLDRIKALMTEKHIALHDTVRKCRRLKGNASDKFLEVVEPVPLFSILEKMPDCRAIATTGEKAAGIIADLTGSQIPKMGEMTETYGEYFKGNNKNLEIWRMPSTSRAYPLQLEKKAEYYAKMFRHLGII